MDYYKIGQRIRKFRKAYHLSQEQLSTTHMSHIETGNTKLSLPVFVDIAKALCVQTDELLHDTPKKDKTAIKGELEEILDSCSMQDMHIIEEVVKAVKVSLDKYRDSY